MAITQGFVQQLVWLSGPTACLWVGADTSSAELLYVASPESVNTSIGDVLVEALLSGREVEVSHPDDSAAITGATLLAGDIAARPLQMEAMEVTQAVQDLAHSVPLLAAKRTVVRAYLSFYGAAPLTVSGQLTARTAPNGPTMVVSSLNSVTLDPADAGNITLARTDAQRSLNFVLPPEATAVGQLMVRLTNVTDTVTGLPVAFGGERRPIVSFQPSPPFRVRIIGFSYEQGNPPVTFTPSALDFNLLLSWLGRAYPVPMVIGSQSVVPAGLAPPFSCGDINARVAAIRALDVNAGVDARTHYYGLVSDGGFFMRGCAGIPGTPNPAAIGSGPTGPATWGWDFDGSYGDWYGGHELGHTLGRLHPGFCGETADDLDSYPFPAGQLSTTDAGYAGFDVGDPANSIPLQALPGTQWHDVMTYCDRQWLSVYTYEGIRQRLLAEDELPATAGGGPAPAQPAMAMAAGAGSGGGRPDQRFVTPPPVDQARAGDNGAVTTPASIIAQVNLTRRQGNIAFVNAVPNLTPTPPARNGPVVLRLSDANGNPVGEHPVAVNLDSELGPEDDQTGLVDVVIAVDRAVTTIDLVVDGESADTHRISGPPPVVRSVRVLPERGEDMNIAVDLDRRAEAGHTFAVQVSTDRGTTWETVGVGLKNPPFRVRRSQFPPRRELMVRVISTNGFTSSEAISEPARTD